MCSLLVSQRACVASWLKERDIYTCSMFVSFCGLNNVAYTCVTKSVHIIRIIKEPVPLHGLTIQVFTCVACLFFNALVSPHGLKNEVYTYVASLLRSALFVTNYLTAELSSAIQVVRPFTIRQDTLKKIAEIFTSVV